MTGFLLKAVIWLQTSFLSLFSIPDFLLSDNFVKTAKVALKSIFKPKKRIF